MKDNIFADKRLNYKDFFIIILAWYFITLSSFFINEKDFANLIYINDFLNFSINVLAQMIFFVIIYLYFNLLYDFSFTELGFKIKQANIKIKELSIIFIILTAGVLLININYNPAAEGSFFPLSLSQNIFAAIYSELPLLILIFLFMIFTAAVEQFLFNKVIFSIFKLYLPSFIASIFTALFAAVLFLEFAPTSILIIFISVIISNYLYIISDYNLINSVIFYSYFLTLYLTFLYGLDFIIF